MAHPHQNPLQFLRRVTTAAPTDRQPLVRTKLSLGEVLAPYIADYDEAIAESEQLREIVANLQAGSAWNERIQTEQANEIDRLKRELAIVSAERTMLRARMVMFGEAAHRITEEVRKEAVDSFKPPETQRQFVPDEEQQTRPVRELAQPEPEPDEPPPAALNATDKLRQLGI